VQYVAYYGDASILEPFEAAQRLREGVEVEEGLGRVLAAAVAGVDHGRRGVAGGEGRSSGGLMPKHDRIGPEAVEGDHGVDKGLALGDSRALLGERDHMRPRTPRGELEGDGCPRRRLEKGQANGLALERIPDTSLRKRPCQGEDLPDVLAANVF
jgi:hypothetical protein